MCCRGRARWASIDAAFDDDVLRRWPAAAFGALLTLCDYSTPVWLAQPDAALASALRFHTGAPLVDDVQEAAFAYIHDAATLPALETFSLGAAETPEHSTMLIIRVDALTAGGPLR